MEIPLEYDLVLKQDILHALRCDELDFNGLLARLKGAQQHHVMPILEDLVVQQIVQRKGFRYVLASPPHKPDWARTRARVIELLSSLPPGNPLAGQWWFNFDSAVWLAERVWESHWTSPVSFVGTPVAGFAYAIATNQPCTIFENDSDVVVLLQDSIVRAKDDGFVPKDVGVVIHDAFTSLPGAYRAHFAAIICDPPWYEDYFSAFLQRSLELGNHGALVYWSLAPLLTRPEAETQRADFLRHLADLGCSVLAIDSGRLTYVIPEFEAEAYRHMRDFRSKVWRNADLLVFRLPTHPVKSQVSVRVVRAPVHSQANSYYNRKQDIRLFHLPARETTELTVAYQEDKDFGRTVSLSGSSTDHIAIWSSRRKGFALSKLPALPAALRLWKEGLPISAIRQQLDHDLSLSHESRIPEAISLLEQIAGNQELQSGIIRYHDELRDKEVASLNRDWATLEHHREREATPDAYRLEFQRDRDKILWSKAFKRLASKTQLFPNFGDDRFRSRLTHTLEVAQIARTLARSFGINEDLTEAIGLAHDIGHTPFGHAGEEAINDFMCDLINHSCDAVHHRSTWFSHYEHGVDILRWLEDLYFSPGAGRAAGLSVSLEIYDGVFKHMYHRCEKTGSRLNRKSQEELYRHSKHKDVIKDTYSRLEGQAVRIADKICYLVQDLEDGILAGVVTLNDLSQCRLFSRPYIDLAKAPGETELHRYISQRGEIINMLTKDTLEQTEAVLQELGTWEQFERYEGYVVGPSQEMAEDISEVWSKLQAGILHKHPRVVGACARASKIVKTLLMLFTFSPYLVEPNFRAYFEFLEKHSHYMNNYFDAVGHDVVDIGKEAGSYFDATLAKDSAIDSTGHAYHVPLRNVVLAKDYVASLTDGQAMQLHKAYSQAGNGSSVF